MYRALSYSSWVELLGWGMGEATAYIFKTSGLDSFLFVNSVNVLFDVNGMKCEMEWTVE